MQTLNQYIAEHPTALTQEQWAKVFGISRSYLSEILSGARRPGWNAIVKINAATGGKVPPEAWLSHGVTA